MRAGLWLVLGLLATACAKSTLPKDKVEAAPSWTTKSGREQARLELVAAMVAANTPEAALQLIGQMRAEGQEGVELDVLQAQALREIGLLEDASELLSNAVRKHPRDVEARNQFGILLVDQKNLEAAIIQFEAASRLDEDNAEIWNNLGFALMSAGRTDEAVVALRRSLRLDASREQTRNNLGFALVAADRADEAFRVFRAGGGEASAHYNVGVGLELKGEIPGARARYLEALSTQPDHLPSKTALKRLEEAAAQSVPLPAEAEEVP